MRIVIATGIYPPEVGGPAYYAQGLAQALRERGHEVAVVRYGALRRFPSGISHVLYTLRLLPKLRGARAVIALDTASVGIPAAFACMLARVPLIIRTGGDFVWEQYLERTNDLVPLARFYAEHRQLSFKERLVLKLTRWALARATVVFSTELQRDLWRSPYQLHTDRTRIIRNAVEPSLPPVAPTRKNFLWYTRPIAIKNGARLHRAFAEAKKAHPEIELEEGALPKDELLERMAGCYAVVLPSITEISPNYILDALRFHKPFIIDKYSGFASWLAPYGTLVDPLDEGDIARAIARLATPDGYAEASERAARFAEVRTYRDVADDFLALIQQGI